MPIAFVQNLGNSARLLRAGRELARHDALFALGEMPLPPGIRALRWLAKLRLPWESAPPPADAALSPGERLANALTALGPSYIKLGQMLATRPDIVGEALARDLMRLQDRLPPFSQQQARDSLTRELGGALEDHFAEFGPPVAAASIAQVHRAKVADGPMHDVAVKILRPNIERAFARDLDGLFWLARLLERFAPMARRLRPLEVVRTLAASVALEMDLRYEAAAASELAENMAVEIAAGEFRVPAVDWRRTARRVLTIEWIDGVAIGERDALIAAGHDPKLLAAAIIRVFLKQAMRDGFFHADMHQGNLFVDSAGVIVAVDFGIMGRLDASNRRYLAEILFGFLRRDYRRVAEVHFEAGFVGRDKSLDGFAQALRSVGEPIFGLRAGDISMGRLLAQLFGVTETFEMRTQPQLLLLQKTMVAVEGVARSLDPEVDFWAVSEPILKGWIEQHLGPEARLAEAAESAVAIARALPNLPHLIERAERAAIRFAEGGEQPGPAPRSDPFARAGWWIAAAALLALAASWF